MDVTQKLLQDELKYHLDMSSSTRLKKTDWEEINSLSFFQNGKFMLNNSGVISVKRVDWDLHHIFKFTKLTNLSIAKLRDSVLISAGGPRVFDYKFWFEKFEHLVSLHFVRGHSKESKESVVYKLNLKDDSNVWIVHDDTGKESEINIYDSEDNKLKTYYFGKYSYKGQQFLIELIKYIKVNKEIPSEEWQKGVTIREDNDGSVINVTVYLKKDW